MMNLLLLLTSLLTISQDPSGPPTLRLETHLVEGKFCKGDDEVATYVMRLRLRYTNASGESIILYKGSNAVATLIVSKSMEAAAAKQYELKQPLTIFRMTARPLSEKTRLDNRFAVLRNGASFDTFVEVAVPFRKTSAAIPGTVEAGEHFLEVEVRTWPESAELAETLRKRWRRRGYLWSEVMQSAPMRFQIDKQVNTVNCSQQQERFKNSHLTGDRVALGEKLYFDKRLSADGTVSCASCHDPASAFASKDTVAIGVRNQSGTRNVPTLLNAKFGESFFWDGRARTLEEQARQPLLNAAEMALESEAALVERLSAIPEYQKAFRRVFPREGITLDTVARAIAAYERTLISENSPFDRFIKGDEKALTPGQKAGWALFKGKARCIECHTSSSHFTDSKFYNTGVAGRGQDFGVLIQRADELRRRQSVASGLVAHQPEFSELGRFLVTQSDKDIGAFKTPTLRDVELTGPYMHNGSLRTLLDVVRFYNQGGQKNPNLNSKMHALDLNETEMNEIVEFLRALTSDDVLRRAQSSKPQTRVAIPLRP